MGIPVLSIKDLIALKGKGQLAYVHVAREEEAITVSQAGMDMIETAFVPERTHFAQDRVAAHKEYISDVTSGALPKAGHIVTRDNETLENVWEA